MANLQTRVMNILKTPAAEWPVIAGEHTDVGSLYTQYIVPLSAIPAVCSFIGLSLVGTSLGFGYYRMPLMTGLSMQIVSYVLGLVGLYLCAMIIEWLAPKFKSSGSRLDALKLVAYASTPVWIAGVLNLIPMLALIGLLAALYAIYVFYLGVPVMMKTPSDQVVPFMIVSALVMVVVFALISTIVNKVLWGGYYTNLTGV